jgi:hypothetical protein
VIDQVRCFGVGDCGSMRFGQIGAGYIYGRGPAAVVGCAGRFAGPFRASGPTSKCSKDKEETNRSENQALEQTRDSVLRYGEVVGCELLNLVVRQQEAQSQSQSRVCPCPKVTVARRETCSASSR